MNNENVHVRLEREGSEEVINERRCCHLVRMVTDSVERSLLCAAQLPERFFSLQLTLQV